MLLVAGHERRFGVVADGDAWLTRKQLAELFEVGVTAIDYQLARIRQENPANVRAQNFWTQLPGANGGARNVEVAHYNTRFVMHVGLSAREAVQLASAVGSGARILVDGLPLRLGQLPTVEALATRKLSIACLSVGDEPQPQTRELAAGRKGRSDNQLAFSHNAFQE